MVVVNTKQSNLMFKIMFCPIGSPYSSNFKAIQIHNMASRSINS